MAWALCLWRSVGGMAALTDISLPPPWHATSACHVAVLAAARLLAVAGGASPNLSCSDHSNKVRCYNTFHSTLRVPQPTTRQGAGTPLCSWPPPAGSCQRREHAHLLTPSPQPPTVAGARSGSWPELASSCQQLLRALLACWLAWRQAPGGEDPTTDPDVANALNPCISEVMRFAARGMGASCTLAEVRRRQRCGRRGGSSVHSL